MTTVYFSQEPDSLVPGPIPRFLVLHAEKWDVYMAWDVKF